MQQEQQEHAPHVAAHAARWLQREHAQWQELALTAAVALVNTAGAPVRRRRAGAGATAGAATGPAPAARAAPKAAREDWED
jgi:hypothetical protein